MFDRLPAFGLEFLMLLLDDFPLSSQLRFERLAFAAKFLEFPLADRRKFVLRPLSGRLRDVAAIGKQLFLGSPLGIPGGPFTLEDGSLLLELGLELAAKRVALDFEPRARRGTILVLAPTALEFAGECPAASSSRACRVCLRASRSSSKSRSTAAGRSAGSAAIWSRRPRITRSCSSRSLISVSQELIFSFRSSSRALKSDFRLRMSSSSSLTHSRALRHS